MPDRLAEKINELNLDTHDLKLALISIIDSKTKNADYKQQLYTIPNNKLPKHLSILIKKGIIYEELQSVLSTLHLASTPDKGVKSNGEQYDTNKVTLASDGSNYFTSLFDYCLHSTSEQPLTLKLLKDRLNKNYPSLVADYNVWAQH
jgi:hypothetical protein